MPLRNVNGKWFWGSKGPFSTKAKALSVARAAYAHGFKEDGENNNNFSSGDKKISESSQPVKK